MSKARFYVDKGKISKTIELCDSNSLHKLKNVLRLKEKDSLRVFDGVGSEYLCVIGDIKPAKVIITQEKLLRQAPEPAKKIILGFPVLREEKIDFILQKATELGVWLFLPFICERGLKKNPPDKKIIRWKKIILEAARQSERLWAPQLSNVLNFEELTQLNYRLKFLAKSDSKDLLSYKNDIKKSKEIFIVIGPEGGFSKSEESKSLDNNFKLLNLSPNILRVETASFFSVGLLNYYLNQNI